MKSIKKAFSMVELLIVISILAILWTISFIAFSSNVIWTRDTNRLEQLATMVSWFDAFSTNRQLPIPNYGIEVRASWSVIWYEGELSKDILKLIEYNQVWKDPKSKEYFVYFVNESKTKFQLLAYLEDKENLQTSFIFNSANALDYMWRYPTVAWHKLWILTESWTNNPLHEVPVLVNSGYLDIEKTTDYYKASFTDTDYIFWTWTKLKIIKDIHANPIKSCLNILKWWNWNKNWIYSINPTWSKLWKYEVYCDMTTDWWWWTLVMSVWNLKTIPIWTTGEYKKDNLITLKTPWKLADSDVNLLYTNQLRTTTTGSWLTQYKLYWKLETWKFWNYTAAWQNTVHMKNGTTYKEDWSYTSNQWIYAWTTDFAFNHWGIMDVWFEYNDYTRYQESPCCIKKPDIFLWVR